MLTIECQGKKFFNVEAIVFDKDGTLEDSGDFLRELGFKVVRLIDAQIPGVSEPLLMSFGITNNYLDPAGLMAVGSRLENEIAAAAYIAETGRSWLEAKKIAHQAFNEADLLRKDLRYNSSIFPGCREVLESLHNAGLKLAILSSDTTANIDNFIQRHQLTDLISIFQGAGQGYSKPDPACFQQVCQKLGVACENTLMVGDSQGDIQMAKNAGAAGVIGICWTHAQTDALNNSDVAISQLEKIKIIG